MSWRTALTTFTKRELRALAKCRGIRWYSYLKKNELAFRLFESTHHLSKTLMLVNQCRRYKTPLPKITL